MNGAEMIAAERARQVADEGYDASHDDTHGRSELAQAAAAYAYPVDLPTRDGRRVHKRLLWPWDDGWREHGREERVRELVKAGALIAAEIDRLNRKGPHA
jgi:hypothetical protein